LIGLSFVPGASAGLAAQLAQAGGAIGGPGLAEAGHLLGRHLLGSAGAFFMQSAAAGPAPQQLGAAGTDPSALISAPHSNQEGQPVPLIYGTVILRDPPVISSGLIVETQSL